MVSPGGLSSLRSLLGTPGVLLRLHRHFASSFLPPFARRGFAFRGSRRQNGLRYYEGSDSCRSHPDRQVSPLTSPCLPDIPTSTTQAVPRPLCLSPQRRGLFQASPNARRLATASRRIRFVLLRTAGSPPVALHPASRRRSYLRLRGCDQPRNGLPPFQQSALTDARASASTPT
jgi:hypothetical protein